MFDALTYEEMPMFELIGIHPELMNYLYIFQSESPDQTIEGKTVKTLWLESDDVEIQEDQNASTEQEIYQMLTQVYWHDTVLLKINYQSSKYSRERMEKKAAYMDRLLQVAVSKNNDTLILKELMEACG